MTKASLSVHKAIKDIVATRTRWNIGKCYIKFTPNAYDRIVWEAMESLRPLSHLPRLVTWLVRSKFGGAVRGDI